MKSFIVHITQEQFEVLCEIFAFLTDKGWKIPEWLADIGIKQNFTMEVL